MKPTRISARVLLLPLSLLLSLSAMGQAPFAEPEIFAEHRNFSAGLVTLDANLDGYDGVVACTTNSGVWHYESTAGGQARLGEQLTDGDMRHPLVHDVDGDGSPDVLGTLDGVGVVVFWNRAGRFVDQDVLVPGGLPLSASGFIDVDRDGTEDLILAGVAGPGLGWCRGLGAGEFDSVLPLWSHTEDVTEAIVVDLEGDGDLDLVMVAPASQRLLAAINDSTPGSVTRMTLASNSGSSRVPVAGDVDGDGLPEILVMTSQGLVSFANLGALAFSPSLAVPFVTGNPYLVDGDMDGDLDLYLSQSSGAFFVNDGAGTFSAAQWLIFGFQGYLAAFGDQDGDGWPDLVTNAQGSYRLTWWRNDTTGVAPFVESTFAVGGAPGSTADIVVLDADADGDQDALVLDYSSGGIQFYGTVGGRPTDTVRSLNPAPGAVAETVITGDLDGDGFPDLVTTALNEVTVWRGLGDGAFVPTEVLPFSVPGTSTRIRPAEPVDLDGDGALDLVISLFTGSIFSPSEVVWCPGDGLGSFGPQRLIGGPWTGQLSAPQVADIDGDAELDVVVANSSDNRIRAWRGMGGGTFGASMTVATGNLPLEFALEDLDEDGDLDTVVLGGPWPYRLYWYPNGSSLGSGVIAETPLATGFHFLDVDRNGRLDIVLRRRVVNGSNDFEFAWMRRTSLTTFDPYESLAGDFEREPFWTIGDLDGDGDDDIVWAGSSITNPPNPLIGVQRNTTLGEAGAAYCDAVPNSTGQPGQLRALGSAQLALRTLRLAVHDLPPQRTVLFLAGRTRANLFPVPSSVGRLCIGGAIGRFVGPGQIQNTGENGEASLALSLAALPSALGSMPALPFETWTFQAWHRDLVGGVPTSNFTRAVEVQFVP